MFTMIINRTDISAKSDFNASVHIEMRGIYGFLSAVDYPLLPVRIFCINSWNEALICFFNITVLWCNVCCLLGLWDYLVGRIVPAMAWPSSNTVLDRWRYIARNVRKSCVLCRVSEHQFKWSVSTRCCTTRWMGIMCETNSSPNVSGHCVARLWHCEVRISYLCNISCIYLCRLYISDHVWDQCFIVLLEPVLFTLCWHVLKVICVSDTPRMIPAIRFSLQAYR